MERKVAKRTLPGFFLAVECPETKETDREGL